MFEGEKPVPATMMPASLQASRSMATFRGPVVRMRRRLGNLLRTSLRSDVRSRMAQMTLKGWRALIRASWSLRSFTGSLGFAKTFIEMLG